ncbi:MAG TPA: NAD(P)-dependent oxidoreductase [Acidobacteriaceae bacterium]|jgi:putative NADH-flavin reductase|nr:NAD(P)-dependent oxidoreductase [Acidobacteriaceae bacterium]
MDIVLFGASGMVGSRVLRELVARGHKVTAVVRDPSRVATGPGVTAVQGDLTVASRVPSYLEGADAVVSAYSPAHGAERELLQATEAVLTGAKQAGVARVLIVGGAASLFIAPEVTLLDSGHLPEEWKAIARAHSDLLALIRKSDVAAELDWTYFSPAAFIQPGERTGKFRLGKDELVTDAQGQSRISAEDYAIALVNELEKPQHVRQRFTIGY